MALSLQLCQGRCSSDDDGNVFHIFIDVPTDLPVVFPEENMMSPAKEVHDERQSSTGDFLVVLVSCTNQFPVETRKHSIDHIQDWDIPGNKV